MPYHLLTGATGLLGGYLLRDLQNANLNLAVIARPVKGNSRYPAQSARQRVDTILRRWERIAGHSLPRPVVFEGDLTKAKLGLNAAALSWISKHCDSVIHNAASLKFVGGNRNQDPWKSNLEGTQNLLDVCEVTGIKNFFHVSTAYICGLREGTIQEDEVDVGQTSANDYEASKLAAEKLVRAAKHLRQVTVLRPSIIAGDSQTGFTSTFHGFYFPLKAGFAFSAGLEQQDAPFPLSMLLTSMGLTGNERKNIVPVDWVSSAIQKIIVDPNHHQQTYHLTSPYPIKLSAMAEGMMESIHQAKPPAKAASMPAFSSEEFEGQFRLQMTAYRSYWKDDPEFCNANLRGISEIVDCPKMDQVLVKRLCGFAIRNGFAICDAPETTDCFDAETVLTSTISASKNSSQSRIGFQINGPGGGQWHADWISNRIENVAPGIGSDCITELYLNTDTLRRLVNRQLSPEIAISAGAVFVCGNAIDARAVLSQLADSGKTSPDPVVV